MRNQFKFSAVVVLTLVLGIAACGRKPSETTDNQQQQNATQEQGEVQQQPTPTAPPAPPSSPAATTPATSEKGKKPSVQGAKPAPVAEAKPKSAPVAESKPVVLPAGTTLTVRLGQSISAKTAKQGETFVATTAKAVSVEGKTAVPAGSQVEGIVTEAKNPGKFSGEGVLSVRLTQLTVNGKSYEIQSEPLTASQKGKGKRTAAVTGGSAAGGALIGGLAGGGKGALIGGVVGAGAGTAGAALTGNKELALPAESALSFRLSQSLTLKP
jgi:hypothetical protein